MNKIYQSFNEAVADVFDGATIMVGGFGGPGGQPGNLLLALRHKGVKNLTLIGNLSGGYSLERNQQRVPPYGWVDPSILIENKQVKKIIASFPVPARQLPITPFEQAYDAGEIELELVAQGTLALRIRAGAAGMGGFYTRTGLGTFLEQGKEKRVLNGVAYLLELPLRADFALIKAYKADPLGNLIYRGPTRTFNAIMPAACDIALAEVDELVPLGGLEAEVIVTPGVYIDRIVAIPPDTPPGINWRGKV